MHEDDVRTFYETYYDGYFMPAWDDAPNALKARIRLALAAVDDERLVRAGKRARTIRATTPMRKAG